MAVSVNLPALIPPLIAAAISLPGGWLAVGAVKRETGVTVPVPAMVGMSLGLAIWAALVLPPDYRLAATSLLSWMLLVLAVTDFTVLRLPNLFTLTAAGAGLLLSFWLPDRAPLAHLVGAAAGFLVLFAIARAYWRIRGREGLGLGDAKLAAAAGAWLGWQALPYVVLIACAAAFIWVGVMAALQGKEALTRELPFGVPLCLAFWLVWLYGSPL
ncbi:MAG: prepilin peptidase [Alphaproteobacteria bacterium]|nr:prepilin peptidase [Alphaproteobacteria bacterium]MBV9062633.1 prepilin peptidase [Alphaproteobacteria bacterium]